MDDYTGYDLEDPAVKIMLALAQALRNVKTPQGQMATTEPTDQDRLVWAAKGANNPLAKALAMDVTKDTLVNAPIRLEKSMLARERMDENQRRFDLDRAERQRANIDRANQRDAELE